MWSYRASVAPITISSLGSIPRGLKDQLKTLQIYHANLIPKMQKSVLLSSCHISCSFVIEYQYSNLCRITIFLYLSSIAVFITNNNNNNVSKHQQSYIFLYLLYQLGTAYSYYTKCNLKSKWIKNCKYKCIVTS